MAHTPLLPVRHKQGDFFIADVFDNLPWKDSTASMEHPLFTLSLKPVMEPLRYKSSDGTASIEMQPSMYGVPNIMDKDILLYCASVVMERVNAGEIPPQTIRLSMRDVLIATNRPTNSIGYKFIKTALNRLGGCMLRTSIKTGRTTQGDGFHLIERYRYLESEHVKDRLIGVEITLSDWFYNSLIAKEVLTIDKEYFRLRKALDRRLYEIARKHCGKAKSWEISLGRLHLKSGSRSLLRRFRHNIRELEKTNHLPEYLIGFNAEKDMVTFHYRGLAKTNKEEQADLFGDDSNTTLSTNIPPDLLDDVQGVVGIGLDYHDLWHQYINWKGSKKAKTLRGGFIGFCNKKAAQAVKL